MVENVETRPVDVAKRTTRGSADKNVRLSGVMRQRQRDNPAMLGTMMHNVRENGRKSDNVIHVSTNHRSKRKLIKVATDQPLPGIFTLDRDTRRLELTGASDALLSAWAESADIRDRLVRFQQNAHALANSTGFNF